MTTTIQFRSALSEGLSSSISRLRREAPVLFDLPERIFRAESQELRSDNTTICKLLGLTFDEQDDPHYEEWPPILFHEDHPGDFSFLFLRNQLFQV